MIEDTIAKIEQRLRTANCLPPNERLELEELLAQLRAEARTLPQEIRSGAPAMGAEDAHTALDRLQESLTEFETTHPQLVGTVNRISTILANMGI
jgi:hypothetical protein